MKQDEVYEWHKTHVHDSSVECGRILARELNIRSAIDYGCGIGSFLLGIKLEAGGINFKGLDIGYGIEYADKEIAPHLVYGCDIFKIRPEKYHTVICMEVAEHIEEEKSGRLVDILTNAEEYIVFTAAPPGQDGSGHINCQPKEYWEELFNKKGWTVSKITEKIKRLWVGAEYYKKNLMIYESDN